MHDAAMTGVGYPTVERDLLQPARAETWYGYLGVDDEAESGLLRALVMEQFVPVDSLRDVSCPFLAVFGGRDVLLPAWRCAQETGDALRAGTGQDATVVVFPTGDHRIRAEYRGYASGHLHLLGDRTERRIRPAG